MFLAPRSKATALEAASTAPVACEIFEHALKSKEQKAKAGAGKGDDEREDQGEGHERTEPDGIDADAGMLFANFEPEEQMKGD